MSGAGLRVLLVDPSLFTGPYDAALSEGLVAAGVDPLWAVRGLRAGEGCELPERLRMPVYYRGAEGSAKAGGLAARLRKGVSHVASSRQLCAVAEASGAAVVHFQWPVLPVVDRWVVRRLGQRRPVVVTVHDTTPFNGVPTSRLQCVGHAALLRAADRLVVHTGQGREALIRLGCAPGRVRVIPHGPLSLGGDAVEAPVRRDPRWTVVLFGKLQPYKGVDVLVAAVAGLDAGVRARVRVIVAGEPFVDVPALRASIAAAGLDGVVELRPARQSEAEMRALFAEADTFVFPYRAIEASGVYHLVKGCGTWIVASAIGCFAEELGPGQGALVPPGDAAALSAALAAAVGRVPAATGGGPGWAEIGAMTRALYEAAIAGRARA